MKTLADAWSWYKATRHSLRRLLRLGGKHWGEIYRQCATIRQDDQFRTLEPSDIVEETTASLGPIDDLAVVVLFSVFEAQVRDRLAERLKPEMDRLKDPILKAAAESALQGVE